MKACGSGVCSNLLSRQPGNRRCPWLSPSAQEASLIIKQSRGTALQNLIESECEMLPPLPPSPGCGAASGKRLEAKDKHLSLDMLSFFCERRPLLRSPCLSVTHESFETSPVFSKASCWEPNSGLWPNLSVINLQPTFLISSAGAAVFFVCLFYI